MRKTKIICTIGPASDSEEVMRELFRAGMNTGRFNFSHGDYAQHERNIARFRKVRDELGVPAAVLLDTKGPEIRVKDFKDGKVMLRDGQPFTLTTREVMGDENRVSVTFDGFAKDLSPHNRVLIDDGKISLDVREVTDTDVICEVIHGGAVSNHKGINVPNVSISLPFMSEKDKADLLFGIENGVDYIAASFTRTAEDVREMRHFLDINGGKDIRIL
ncbi:pyruvate kinase, partial [uncultured Eubacterium sp.]|uniref:pyruvate kinase n=1 Tax=uncultured Eubacterium sp. TaxID=165185 RepID=UPI0025966889